MIWITWFARVMIIYTIVSILVTIIGIIPIQARPTTNSTNTYVTRYIFQTTNIGIVFMMFFVYSLQVAMFIILMAQIFSKRTSIIIIFLIDLKRKNIFF
jgi:hypothetical protein